jgi:hypothetical protein
VIGAWLYHVDHWFIGTMVLLGALPIALVAWISFKERY